MHNEDDYLLMSGIQHFDFCRRQWALIHIEQQWNENQLTAEGRIQHKKCHDEFSHEKRGNVIIFRGMRVVSHRLCLTGICDVVEFHSDEKRGVELQGYEGKWIPVPIEYKHGEQKVIDADRIQLCAQGMALEEMLVCSIEYGYVFYEKTRRRELIAFDEELRQKTTREASEMSEYFTRGYIPRVKSEKKCFLCSLKDICLPGIDKKYNVELYINEHLKE